jgi:fatty-acyl-CoA synthase
MSKFIYEAIRTAAARDPHAIIFRFLDAGLNESAWTHERLHVEIESVAAAISSLRPDAHFPVAILFQSQESQVLHYLATLSLGLRPAILTPPNRKLNRAYYLETMASILSSCRFSAVLSDVPGIAAQTGSIAATPLLADTAFVQFSSGTTGIKRGVEISHEAALCQIETYSRAIGLSREDRIISWLPLYHDMGFMTSLNMSLVEAVESIMIQPGDWVADPGMYLRAISRYGATLGWNPNFAYKFMAERVKQNDLADLDLSTLRALVNCSEPVTMESQRSFRDRFAPCGLNDTVFRGCYAMAETTFALTHGDATDTSVGRILKGVELVVDKTGELRVKSPFNFSCYYSNPEATAAALEDGWYKTGDLGYSVGDQLYVQGRKKDLIIVAGENYFPGDLEDVVSAIPGVHPGRVCSFAQFNPATQTDRAIILAEQDAPSTTLLLSVRQELAARFQFTGFEVHFVPAGWLIKSSSGKMARTLNRERWIDRMNTTCDL